MKLTHAAASRGVTSAALKRMLMCGLPLVLVNALCFLQAVMPFSPDHVTDMSELFSGAGHVALPFKPRAAEFDIERSPMENINSPEGFLTALRVVRDTNHRSGRRGTNHWGTVCSTWVYLSRSSTGRSLAFPLGNVNQPVVRQANTMLARVCLCIVFGCCLRLAFFHEQPASSLASSTKFLLWVRSVIIDILEQRWDRFLMWMGHYGGHMQKPTEVCTNTEWGYLLRRPLSMERRQELWAVQGVQHLPGDQATGKRRISGAQGLKDSQVYPREYGEAIHDLWEKHAQTLEIEEEVSSDEDLPWQEWSAATHGCDWPETRLTEVAELIGVPSDSFLP